MMHSQGPGFRFEGPSPAVRSLIQRAAELVLDAPSEWLAELDQALMAATGVQAIAKDPVLSAGMRRATRSNLAHWAEANIREPGAPVAPNVSEEPLAIARELVRRGLEDQAVHTYRTGQNAAWLRWMDIAFSLTQDAAELHELLSVTARSITDFNEACIAELSLRMQAERDELTRGTHAERRATVALIVEGAPISIARAEHSLGYALDQAHRAVVVWSESADSRTRELEQVAESVAQIAGTARFLSVVASTATLWLWLPTSSEPNLARIEARAHNTPDVRIAVGSSGAGVEGFRKSHLDALAAQRMLARVSSRKHVVSFDRVRLVSLITSDREGADHFVRDTLGELATAELELRTTVAVFLEEGCNASRTAERLSVHRNTLQRRLDTVDTLLPRPLQEARVHVGVALELLDWR
ncbi:MAG TPA: PucR family transcriptional regulator [Polyangiales bacterium]|nr:PucR family transcriptional regulator [Polyangiales bacterium]